MIIIGVDVHPEFQQIAFVDTDTGELEERRVHHPDEAEAFYRALVSQGKIVRVGMEASGHARWFERLLGELQRSSSRFSRFYLGQEVFIRADRLQLIRAQAAQLFLFQPALVEQFTQDVRQSRATRIVLLIDRFTASCQVILQIPQLRRLLDPIGHLLGFLYHLV